MTGAEILERQQFPAVVAAELGDGLALDADFFQAIEAVIVEGVVSGVGESVQQLRLVDLLVDRSHLIPGPAVCIRELATLLRGVGSTHGSTSWCGHEFYQISRDDMRGQAMRGAPPRQTRSPDAQKPFAAKSIALEPWPERPEKDTLEGEVDHSGTVLVRIPSGAMSVGVWECLPCVFRDYFRIRSGISSDLPSLVNRSFLRASDSAKQVKKITAANMPSTAMLSGCFRNSMNVSIRLQGAGLCLLRIQPSAVVLARTASPPGARSGAMDHHRPHPAIG